LEVAKSRCRAVRLLRGDACSLSLADGGVDVVFALHVVEHLTTPTAFFGEAYRVLRPGGLLVIATPNSRGLGARLMRHRWMGYNDPTHISLNGPMFWRNLLQQTGFKVVRDGTTGLSGIPLLNRMPFGLVHWIPTFIFGYYRWLLGEAYMCTASRLSSSDGQ